MRLLLWQRMSVARLRVSRAACSGEFAGQRWSVDGRRLTEDEWKAYAPTVLPASDDEAQLKDLFKNPAWIAPKGNMN